MFWEPNRHTQSSVKQKYLFCIMPSKCFQVVPLKVCPGLRRVFQKVKEIFRFAFSTFSLLAVAEWFVLKPYSVKVKQLRLG